MLLLLLFLGGFFIVSSQNANHLSICSQILLNRKKQNGTQNQEFKNSVAKLSQIVHDDCFIQLVPKYYWAQNMSFIMVKIEFQVSSRTSCSQLIYSEKDIKYDGFYLKIYCLQSDQILKYSLQIKTYKNLNFHFSKWKNVSLNGLILQCMKSPVPYFWPKLYSLNTIPSKKPRIWWQLQQKQPDQVQKYMGLLQIDESEIDVSNLVKKYKKSKLRKSSSHIQFYCNGGNPYYLGSWL